MKAQWELKTKQQMTGVGRLLKWEYLLILILLAVLLGLKVMEPGVVNMSSILENSMVFMDKGFIVLSMMLILVLGEIDISVGSILCLSGVVMAVLNEKGIPFGLALAAALAVGVVCGFFNGWIITTFKELAPMIVTLATMTIYRGIAYMILRDEAAGGFPEGFSELGWGYVAEGVPIPINLVVFLLIAAVFYIVISHTMLGRQIYAIGTNALASEYNGIPVKRIKLALYTLNGLMSAVAGIFLMARLGSARPNVAEGYELDVIAMCVLGGVSTAGGKGTVGGAVLSVFLIGYFRYGMNIKNVPGQIMPMVIGILLIVVLVVPNVVKEIKVRRQVKHRSIS
ncbi:MAG: ABC transporter permease [Blautia sp.]|jgi:rhamnose transport system permease protein